MQHYRNKIQIKQAAQMNMANGAYSHEYSAGPNMSHGGMAAMSSADPLYSAPSSGYENVYSEDQMRTSWTFSMQNSQPAPYQPNEGTAAPCGYYDCRQIDSGARFGGKGLDGSRSNGTGVEAEMMSHAPPLQVAPEHYASHGYTITPHSQYTTGNAPSTFAAPGSQCTALAGDTLNSPSSVNVANCGSKQPRISQRTVNEHGSALPDPAPQYGTTPPNVQQFNGLELPPRVTGNGSGSFTGLLRSLSIKLMGMEGSGLQAASNTANASAMLMSRSNQAQKNQAQHNTQAAAAENPISHLQVWSLLPPNVTMLLAFAKARAN